MSEFGWGDLFDGLTLLVAAAGLYVGFHGLRAWRQQTQGTAEYELAKRLLLSTYRLREAIAQVRLSGMFGSEMDQPENPQFMSEGERRHFGLASAYRARWKFVSDARVALDADRLEAEVDWGSRIGRELYLPIFALQARLIVAVQNFLASVDPKTSEARRQVLEKRSLQDDETLFDSTGEDAFAKEFAGAVQPIEEFLRPFLRLG